MNIPYSKGKINNIYSRLFPPRYHNYIYFWKRQDINPPTIEKQKIFEESTKNNEPFEPQILEEEIKIKEEKKPLPSTQCLQKGSSHQVILQQWKETEIILSLN
jgi:hypothetical protein